jgi:hypothetical protein
MNNNLRYEWLKKITENVKPYRGTTDKYPFSDRKHNYKYFVPVEVNGEVEYHVGYYHKWYTDDMTGDEFNARKESMDKKELKQWHEKSEWDSNARTYQKTGTYERNFKNPKVDLIVRADNTVEIVTDSFHQGMRMIFSAYSYSKGVFQSSVNHGGIIYTWTELGVTKTIPIFKGMRFNMDTKEIYPSAQYIAKYRTVDRKLSKEAMSIYQDKLNGAFAFITCMDKESFREDIDSVTKELIPDNVTSYYWGSESQNKAEKLADSIFFEKPVEAIYLYMKSFHVGYYLSSMAHPSDWIRVFKKKFAKYIHAKHDTFSKEYLTHLENFKSSQWNIDVTVNGKMVERLK